MSDKEPEVGTFGWATKKIDEMNVAAERRERERVEEMVAGENDDLQTVEQLRAEIRALREEVESLRDRLSSLERWTHYKEDW